MRFKWEVVFRRIDRGDETGTEMPAANLKFYGSFEFPAEEAIIHGKYP